MGELQVVEEKTVLFYEDELIAAKVEDGSIYVPVRRLCENLGLTWPPQWQRIQRSEALKEAVRSVIVTITDLESKFTPGQSEMLCLPLDLVPGWLFGVTASRVREDIRPKLLRYQRECFRVLWDAFKGDMLPELQEPATDLTMAEKTLVQAEAFYNMARQQVVMERWLKQHDWRLAEAEDRIEDLETLVEDLRLRVQGPERLITDAQAAEIAAAVKAVAFRLTEQDMSRNWYQSIYHELYRRFGVTGYKQVPAEQFGAVMAWLKEYGARLAH